MPRRRRHSPGRARKPDHRPGARRSRPNRIRPDLAARVRPADMDDAAFEAWDARTMMAAMRAFATCKLLLGARLARALPDFDGEPFCRREACALHSECLGEDQPLRLWPGARSGRPPHAPPCIYALALGGPAPAGPEEEAAILATALEIEHAGD